MGLMDDILKKTMYTIAVLVIKKLDFRQKIAHLDSGSKFENLHLQKPPYCKIWASH